MKRSLLLSVAFLLASFSLDAQNFAYSNSWGNQGFNLTSSKSDAVQIIYSIRNFTADPVVINGQSLKRINLPGVFLFNDAGKPDIPGTGRYIAIPQGSTPHVRITDFEVETIQGIDLA